MVHFKKKPDVEEVAITISFSTFIRLMLLIAGSIILFGAIQKAAHALLLIVVAFFLTLALNSPVNWLSNKLPGKTRGSRSLATTASFLIVVIAIVGFAASFAPSLVKQTQEFISATPKLVKSVQDQNSSYSHFIRQYNLQDDIDGITTQLSGRFKSSGNVAVTTAKKIGSSFLSILTVLVLTFMMLVEGPKWLKMLSELMPAQHQKLYRNLVDDMYGVIKGYVNGQLFLASLAAIIMLPVLLILHIKFPIALMVIILICGLVPMVGHTIGAIIVTAVALFTSLNAALIILAFYILYQQIENYTLQPRIQANTTNMSPLLVFASLVIGATIGGVIGGLLAIPVAGCIRIALLEYLRSTGVINTKKFKELTTETR